VCPSPVCYLGEDRLLVVGGLAVEALEARHGHHAHAGAQLLGGVHGPLQLGAGGEEDVGERSGLLDGHVAALEGALAAVSHGDLVQRAHVLWREVGGCGEKVGCEVVR
jgi:hypothetical protein